MRIETQKSYSNPPKEVLFVRRDRGLPPVVNSVGKAKGHDYLYFGIETSGTSVLAGIYLYNLSDTSVRLYLYITSGTACKELGPGFGTIY